MSTHSDRIVELQRAIKEALPEESRHLLGELEQATSAQWLADEDRLVETIAAHLPSMAGAIRGVYAHIENRGEYHPQTLSCCEPH